MQLPTVDMPTTHPVPAPVDVVVVVVVVDDDPPPDDELAPLVGPPLEDVGVPLELEAPPPLPPVPVNGSHDAVIATISASTPTETFVRDSLIMRSSQLVL